MVTCMNCTTHDVHCTDCTLCFQCFVKLSTPESIASHLSNRKGGPRYLGDCEKCKRQLIEEPDDGFFLYNAQKCEADRIVFTHKWTGAQYTSKPIFRCRPCATKAQIKKHDKTF
jgi:hypothetical protein